MDIINIKKNYGSMSTVVLYKHQFTANPPCCTLHSVVNCQICFKRGRKKNIDEMSREDLKRYYVNRKSSTRRSKTSVTDYALCNEFSQFITLTFDSKKEGVDFMDYDLSKKQVSKWINNQRRHSPLLTYILVAEKHKKGGIHFHMIVNNFNGELTEARNKKTGRKIIKNGKQIYNLDGWNYGFSTLSQIKDKKATAWYLQKYLTKDFIEAFNKKRFWTSRGLIKPTKEYNVDFDEVKRDFPPLFRKLYKSDNFWKYTLTSGAEVTVDLEKIKRFTQQKMRDMVNTH